MIFYNFRFNCGQSIIKHILQQYYLHMHLDVSYLVVSTKHCVLNFVSYLVISGHILARFIIHELHLFLVDGSIISWMLYDLCLIVHTTSIFFFCFEQFGFSDF